MSSRETRRHQAVDGKRAEDYFVDPDCLYMETDKRAPLYDPRIELEVLDSQVDVFAQLQQTKDVVVRNNGGRLEVISGLQTLKTILKYNKLRKKEGLPLAQVRITVRKAPTDADVLLFREAANLRRPSLPSMLATAVFQHQQQGIAIETSVTYLALDSVSHAQQLLKLYELHRSVKDAVDEGRLSLSRAVKRFKGMALTEQKEKLEEVISGRDPTQHAPKKLKTGRPSIAVVRKLYEYPHIQEKLTKREVELLHWVLEGGDLDNIVKGLSAAVSDADPEHVSPGYDHVHADFMVAGKNSNYCSRCWPLGDPPKNKVVHDCDFKEEKVGDEVVPLCSTCRQRAPMGVIP